MKGEQDQAKRVHLIQFYGLYQDQSVQDYVQRRGGVLMSVGAVAAATASGSEAIAQMVDIGATA